MSRLASFKLSRPMLYQMAGLAVFSASAALVVMGQMQLAIWLVLSGLLAFVVENHSMAVAAPSHHTTGRSSL